MIYNLERLKYVIYLRLSRKGSPFYFFNNTIGVDKEGRREARYLVSPADCLVWVEQHREGETLRFNEALHKCRFLSNADGEYFQFVT